MVFVSPAWDVSRRAAGWLENAARWGWFVHDPARVARPFLRRATTLAPCRFIGGCRDSEIDDVSDRRRAHCGANGARALPGTVRPRAWARGWSIATPRGAGSRRWWVTPPLP